MAEDKGLFGSLSSGLGLVSGLAPVAFKLINGLSQSRRSKGIKPTDPGYQVNRGVIENANIARDNYFNYTMPGYSQANDNIDRTFDNALYTGAQGATSGGDVLDLASKLAYGRSNATNNLAVQNAAGKQQAMGTYFNANAAAGQEGVNENAYARDVFQGKMREKAGLIQAGTANTYGAIDQLGAIAGKYLLPQTASVDPNGFSPEQTELLNSLIQKLNLK